VLRVSTTSQIILEVRVLLTTSSSARDFQFFDVADKFKVYPLAGLGYTNWSYKYEYAGNTINEGSDGRLAINLGGGVEYELTKNLNVNAEAKYQIISNYNQLVLGVGVAYKF